jgi:hypothetical protein
MMSLPTFLDLIGDANEVAERFAPQWMFLDQYYPAATGRPSSENLYCSVRDLGLTYVFRSRDRRINCYRLCIFVTREGVLSKRTIGASAY